MRLTEVINVLVFLIFFTLLTPLTLLAEDGDFVENVSVCGPDVIITMQNAGKVVVMESEVGQDNLDLILTKALALYNSGEATGFFDPGDPIDVCGIENVKPITVLETINYE